MQIYDRSLAFHVVEETFREVLTRDGNKPPILARVSMEVDHRYDRILFEAKFCNSVIWGVAEFVRWEMGRNKLDRIGVPRLASILEVGESLVADYRSFYSRMYEDYLIQMAPQVENLCGIELRSHQIDAMMRVQRDARLYGVSYMTWQYLDDGTPAAQSKGLDLLKSWLTPEQLASFEKTKSFEVVGSHTKKRYRIRHGRQMNIDEIDASGNRVFGFCAVPDGGVVAGDCMLAQKLEIENNETQFLAVANKFA